MSWTFRQSCLFQHPGNPFSDAIVQTEGTAADTGLERERAALQWVDALLQLVNTNVRFTNSVLLHVVTSFHPEEHSTISLIPGGSALLCQATNEDDARASHAPSSLLACCFLRILALGDTVGASQRTSVLEIVCMHDDVAISVLGAVLLRVCCTASVLQ